ncbi:MAG: sodium:solute symporter family protein [Verrucomicrobia bacterium]|nr:sodium:solute symporter family protein [Verrucomicrobiota bacterium]
MSATNSSLATFDMGNTPIIVLILYMILLIGCGIIAYLKSKTSEEDYYLAGRGQGVLVTALTIMATFFSSAAMLGVPGLIYKDGMSFVFFALNLPLSGAAIYVLGSRIRRLGNARGYVTPADMVVDFYGGSSMLRSLIALVGFLYVIPYIVMQIKAGGYLAQRMFPDAESISFLSAEFGIFEAGTIALSVITMVYVLIGGLRSVAWTDVIQGFLLLSGMIIAGLATVMAMGGPGPFFKELAQLPPEANALPGPSGDWSPWKLMTICMFASLGTMIQPGQWMRYYAARSTNTLKQSALIFALVIPICFLFGVMLVGLGARVIYPPSADTGVLLPHPAIGSQASEFDQVVVAMVQEHVPLLLGHGIGVIVVSVILVAVMAASMSTADSNLHALSAVLTRDVYDKFVRPKADERERTWFGRIVIIVATLLSLWLVSIGDKNPDFKPLALIAQLMFVAMAFSCQLLPLAIDVLFLRRGTQTGAIWGILSGILVVFLFTPVTTLLPGHGFGNSIRELTGTLSKLFDIGFVGVVVNALVFVIVSKFTEQPAQGHKDAFKRDMEIDLE